MSKIVVANWKANPRSQKEAENLRRSILKEVKGIKNTQIVICPPVSFLYLFEKNKSKKIILGAQDVSENISGPYTGEIPPEILKNMGVRYVIIGHSSRRSNGETDQAVNRKILNLLKFKLTPIICVGENNRDKDGAYLSFVEKQLKSCLVGIPRQQMKNVIITYEPVWAISSNKVREATKEEFVEMKIFIKKVISDIYSSVIAHSIPILYGGSVSPFNVQSFIEEGGADGVLVGRDSLDPKKFIGILRALN